MVVAFWSDSHARGCTSCNLAILSVLSTMVCKTRRICLFENHNSLYSLGKIFYNPYPMNVREENAYKKESGLSRSLRIIERGEELSYERVWKLANNYFGNRMMLLPCEGAETSEMLEYRLDRYAIPLLKNLESMSDCVFVDLSSTPNNSSRKILEYSDLVVVNISQNDLMLSHIFNNYSSLKQKAFFLLGNYFESSELSMDVIMNKYCIPSDSIAAIPHNVDFLDSVSDGSIIPFLLNSMRAKKYSPNKNFILDSVAATKLFYKQLKLHAKER